MKEKFDFFSAPRGVRVWVKGLFFIVMCSTNARLLQSNDLNGIVRD